MSPFGKDETGHASPVGTILPFILHVTGSIPHGVYTLLRNKGAAPTGSNHTIPRKSNLSQLPTRKAWLSFGLSAPGNIQLLAQSSSSELANEWGSAGECWLVGFLSTWQHFCWEPFNQLGHHGQIYQRLINLTILAPMVKYISVWYIWPWWPSGWYIWPWWPSGWYIWPWWPCWLKRFATCMHIY